METFNFPFHTLQIRYPEQPQVKFGKGYSYGVKPLLPVMRTFLLSFNTMRWHTTNGWVGVSAVPEPTQNMKALLDFYEAHGMWRRFIYSNQVFGTTIVKFSAPLETPKSHMGGTGWVEPFELQLEEQAG